jgi:hypothetical protein
MAFLGRRKHLRHEYCVTLQFSHTFDEFWNIELIADRAREGIAAIEKHLGIDKKIAA